MAEVNAKIIGKVTPPVAPDRKNFEDIDEYQAAVKEYNKDMAEYEAEQKEAAELRAKAAEGDHGPAEAGPGAGSPNYDDGNIRVIKEI